MTGPRQSRRSIDRFGFLHDADGRRRRGRRIVHALEDFGGVDVARARILDIGCSAGLIAGEIARHADCVAGVDVDLEALAFGARLEQRVSFVAASGAKLPFAEGVFDAVACNHVYEHVPDATALMREIRRVLRPGGGCYFAGGHTLQLIEPHYQLPLLSWFPRGIASAWLRASGRGENYEERFVPPWRLRRLFKGFASVQFVTPAMLRMPERYGFPRLTRCHRTVRAAAGMTGGIIARLAPTWIFVLRR